MADWAVAAETPADPWQPVQESKGFEEVSRGLILPLARDKSGNLHPAVPGILKAVADAIVSGLTLPGDVVKEAQQPAPATISDSDVSTAGIGRVLDLAGLGITPSPAMGTGKGIAAAARGEPPAAAPADAASSAGAPAATAESARAIPASAAGDVLSAEAEKAGNINLARINAPEDVKAVIKDVAAQNSEFTGARRGVISQAETAEMAQLVGMTPEKLAERVKGQAFNAEEMFAARNLLVDQATKVRDLAKAAQGGSDLQKAQFIEEMTRLVTIQEQVSGATAEAGRALAQFRMIADRENIAGMVDAAKSGIRLDDVLAKVNSLDDPAQVAQFARGVFKAKTSDMVLEAWINALLSGPRTHATNILSNALVSAWSVAESAAASGISKITGSGIAGREAFERLFGYLEGAKEGIVAGAKAFRTEMPSDAALKIEAPRMQAIPSAKVNIGGREMELGGRQVRLPGRALMAEDEFFKSIAYRQQVNALAARTAAGEGLKGRAFAARIAELKSNPTEAMSEAARAFAAKQTFSNPLGPGGRSVMQFTSAFPVARVVLPFIRTPVNIVKFAADRSPFAPLFSEARANLLGKNGAAARDEQIARIMMGSTVGAATAYMAASGSITGGGPADKGERALKYADGWQPYSVRIGDQLYSYSRLEPLGMLMGVSADMAELSKYMKDGERDNIAALVMGSISKNLVSKTWLQGPSDLIQTINDPDRYGARYIQRMTGTLVPTALAQAADWNDPYLREARSALDAIRNRIPGQKEQLPLKRDVFGQPIKREGGLGPDLISPIYQSVAKNDPAVAELLRLGVTPGSLPRQIRGVDLEPKEYDQYSRVAGTLMKQSLDALVAHPSWALANDDIKTQLMGDAIRKSRDLARSQTMVSFPDLVMRIAAEKKK